MSAVMSLVESMVVMRSNGSWRAAGRGTDLLDGSWGTPFVEGRGAGAEALGRAATAVSTDRLTPVSTDPRVAVSRSDDATQPAAAQDGHAYAYAYAYE